MGLGIFWGYTKKGLGYDKDNYKHDDKGYYTRCQNGYGAPVQINVGYEKGCGKVYVQDDYKYYQQVAQPQRQPYSLSINGP